MCHRYRARSVARAISRRIGWAVRSTLLIVLTMGGLACGAHDAVAQVAAVVGVTYGQPKVSPREFNVDLSPQSSAEPNRSSGPPPFRPLQRSPAQTKFAAGTAARVLAPDTLGAALAMPGPIQSFAGLSADDVCGVVFECYPWPASANGDVGPNHYIEAVNNGVIAIYSKAGALLGTFPTWNLPGSASTIGCFAYDADPFVLYDRLANRFIVSWHGYGLGDDLDYRCIAASKTSDPVAGGWWLYAFVWDSNAPGFPPHGDVIDSTTFGLWHDCLYMSTNELNPLGTYDGVAFASFSRSDLFSGKPLTYAVGWLPPASNAFGMVPSNNLGSGPNAAQPGTPNYFVSESRTSFSFEVRTFTPGPNCGAGGTLSAPTNVSHASYSRASLGNEVPQPNTSNRLDNLDDRILPKVQYRKIGSTESLWVTHNVDPCADASCTTSGPTAMQWAQLDVTGGAIATTPAQQQIYTPDATLYRWMGSLAVDSQGNMALGYSTSNGSAPNFPSIAYSGRLATDAPSTLPQTEAQLTAGAGSQVSCFTTACNSWGRYSAMSVDPADDCTFWYVNEYFSNSTDGLEGLWQTHIGSFRFPSCTGLAPTTTTLASSFSRSVVGQDATLTATVTGIAPTGSVAFIADGTTLRCFGANVLPSGNANAKTAFCGTASLSAGIHNIVASYGGDSANASSVSTALSQVVIAVPHLANPSFEIPALGSSYKYNPSAAGIGWTFIAGSGIQGNRSALGSTAAPNGNQTAFIKGTGIISQTLSLDAGTYTLSFRAASRPCCATASLQPIKVTVDGSQIGALISPASTGFGSFAIPFSVASGGAHTITFAVTGPSDKSTFIDAVGLDFSFGKMTVPISSRNPVKVGQSVTFTAGVSGIDPAGTVAFTSNGKTIAGCGSVALTGLGATRTAACTTAFAGKGGIYSIVATYSGDGRNPASASPPFAEIVTWF